MSHDTDNVQDNAIDQSTGVQVQHFDDEGYVVGHEHREHLSPEQIAELDDRLGERPPVTHVDEYATRPRITEHRPRE